MTNPVPSLSASGWVTEVGEKADKLFAYFFLSEYLQSNSYKGSVASLPHLIKKYGHDELQLVSMIRETLSRLFEAYFDKVEVDVHVKPENESTFGIVVSSMVEQDGVPYNIAKEVAIQDSVIVDIMNANNGQ